MASSIPFTSMKNKISDTLVIGLLIVRIVIINLRNFTNTDFQSQTGFIDTILEFIFYAVLAILIWRERERPTINNIDKLSMVLIIFSGSVLRLLPVSESAITVCIDIVLLSGVSVFLIIKYREMRNTLRSIRVKDILWMLFAFVGGIILSLLLSYSQFIANGAVSTEHEMNIPSLVIYFIMYFNISLSHASLIEEPLFRGFLWGYFAKRGISSRAILFLTTFLFWISHINYFDQPYSFWIKAPIVGLFLGLLVWRSGSLSSSFMAHSSYNATLSLSYDIFRLLVM